MYQAFQNFLPGSFVSIHSISVEWFAFWKFNNSVLVRSGNFRGKVPYYFPNGEYWECRGAHSWGGSRGGSGGSVEPPKPVDYDAVVQKFAEQQPRRMLLADPIFEES